MKKALDQNNKMVDIIESTSNNTYHCPVCKKELIRNFGAVKQFYSHQKDVDATDCEIKMKLIIKEDKSIFQQSDTDILSTEFYNKQFDDVEVEMSDYMSEEGYWLTKEQKDIIFSTEDRVKVSALAGCVDGDTEFFHGTGWKKISEYQQGDKVFQFNDKWEGELGRPLDYFNTVSEQLVRIRAIKNSLSAQKEQNLTIENPVEEAKKIKLDEELKALGEDQVKTESDLNRLREEQKLIQRFVGFSDIDFCYPFESDLFCIHRAHCRRSRDLVLPSGS